MSKSKQKNKHIRKNYWWIAVLILVGAIIIASLVYLCRPHNSSSTTSINDNYTIVMTKFDHSYPHDSSLFTQGISLYNSTCYIESGGLYGQSRIQFVNLEDGIIIKKKDIDKLYFAEGLTYVNDNIIMLTWKENTGFLFNDKLEMIKQFRFSSKTGEGWGITSDNTHFIISDGSNALMFWDKQTFVETHRINVRFLNNTNVYKLNELSYIHGYIFANIWYTNFIVQINPETGFVVKIYDMSFLLNYLDQEQYVVHDVLNGIAYDNLNQILYVTGKKWNKLFSFNNFIPYLE